ncbi:MAG: 4Fe-4S binding protein [Euryarchaeota archaeon]|nr:4Fe-4S binding protein [Euryarchaeota archaeon]
MSYKEDGVLSTAKLNLPSEKRLKRGPVAILECIENIPCDPCVDACPFDAISMEEITDLPKIDYEKCTGCGSCVSVCPGLAIFVVDLSEEKARVTMPYEFLPIPEKGEKVKAVNRKGEVAGDATVMSVRKNKNKTNTVTVEVDKKLGMKIRHIKVVR